MQMAVALRQHLAMTCAVPLVSLELRSSQLAPELIMVLSKALESNDSLTYLGLSFNAIGSVGAASLSEMLKFNGCLATLDLSSDVINPLGALQVCLAIR